MKVLASGGGGDGGGVAVEVEATVWCEPSQIHSRSLLAERRPLFICKFFFKFQYTRLKAFILQPNFFKKE